MYGMAMSLVVAAACGGKAAEPSDVTRRALADTLTGLISDAYDFSRPGVAERMMELYADSGPVVSASGGTIVVGRDTLQASIATFWENVGRNMRNPVWKWGEIHVEPLGAGAASLTAAWSIPHIAPDSQPHVISGAWTAVFRRTSSGWRIVQEHLSVPR
jgi:ketosteroid isomerase-like protein